MIPESEAFGPSHSWDVLPDALNTQPEGHQEFGQFRGNDMISTLSDRKGWAMMTPLD